MRRGDGGEGAAIGELSFAPANRVLDEGWRGQVGVNPDGKEAVLDKGQTLARDCGRLGTHTLPVRVARKRTSGVGIGRKPIRENVLHLGQTVRVEIERIGELVNTVVAEPDGFLAGE